MCGGINMVFKVLKLLELSKSIWPEHAVGPALSERRAVFFSWEKSFLNEPPGTRWNLRTALNFTKGRLPFPCASNCTLWCAVQERKKREIRSSYCQGVESGGDLRRDSKKEKDRNAVERWREEEQEEAERELEGATLRDRKDDGGRRRRMVCSFFPLFSLCCCISQEQHGLLSSQNEDALNPALLMSAVANSTDSCTCRETDSDKHLYKEVYTRGSAHILRYDEPTQTQTCGLIFRWKVQTKRKASVCVEGVIY